MNTRNRGSTASLLSGSDSDPLLAEKDTDQRMQPDLAQLIASKAAAVDAIPVASAALQRNSPVLQADEDSNPDSQHSETASAAMDVDAEDDTTAFADQNQAVAKLDDAPEKAVAVDDADGVAVESKIHLVGSGRAAPIGIPIRRRVFCDPGIDLDSRQNPLMEGFALTTMAIYLGFIHLLGLLLVGCFFSRWCIIASAVIWGTLLLPAEPLLWEAFLTNPVWKAWRRYFRFSVIIDENFELKGKRYVIAEYPHGVFPLSQLIAVSLTDAWPNHPIYSLAADSLYYVPLWRHIMSWIGSRPATADNFRQLLKKGSVGLVPGGIAEMFMVEEDREVIKLCDRKGFVRIAVEQGAALVPCYHFGNSRLFAWGPKSWEGLARRHRVALGFMFGRWGLPMALPNRVPLMMVVGGPIPVTRMSQDDPGFANEVDRAHGELVSAMQALYDKYKGEYGWSHHPLVIK